MSRARDGKTVKGRETRVAAALRPGVGPDDLEVVVAVPKASARATTASEAVLALSVRCYFALLLAVGRLYADPCLQQR